jgi:hypothetical protein
MEFAKYLLKVLGVVVLTAWLIMLVGGVLIGVWLPDIVFAPRKTLAKTTLANGQSFEVIQYWNRSDFYSTELHIKTPDGFDQVVTLDGDDAKSWSVPMQVDAPGRAVTVTLGGGRIKTVLY